MEAADKSFKGKERHAGVKELAKGLMGVQQHSGRTRGAEPFAHLDARHPPGLSWCRILYMFTVLYETEN